MGTQKQNFTLVIEEDLLREARKIALDRRTSVTQMVREYLAALVEVPNRRRLARTRLRKAFETGLIEVGDRNGAARNSMTGEIALGFVDKNVLVYDFEKTNSRKRR